MVDTTSALPDDVDELKALLQAQTRRHEAELKQRDTTIERLYEHINLLLAKRFGPSSERVSDAQLQLFNEAEALLEQDDALPSDEPETEVPAHRRKAPKRRALPEHLPRTVIVHDLDEADKHCPHDGEALVRMGEQTSEQLDIIPAQIRVLRHERLKYCCPRCHGHIRVAPMTPQPIPKSMASPGLLAYIATSKYVDALPLYRQCSQFERIGVQCSRTTLANWMIRVGELLVPLINLMREELLASGYIHMDESTLQVLKESGKSAQSKSYMWVQCSADPERPVILFDYDPTRSGQVPIRLLEGFQGVLQVDGYSGYHAVIAQRQLTQLGCLAHARRYFVEAVRACGLNPDKLPAKPPDKARRPLKALAFFKTLYTIERRLKRRGASADERYRARQAESVPALEKLHQWSSDLRPKVAPDTKLGIALNYLNNQWPTLIAYCEDGRYHIDNNVAENAIRPFCVGRKNYLFSDTPAGARASATLYSIIETAKACQLEPYAYLRHVLTELPKAQCVNDIELLLPSKVDANLPRLSA